MIDRVLCETLVTRDLDIEKTLRMIEVADRIGILADAADAEDEALVELREVERQLQTAGRRLAKIVRRLS